MLGIVYVAFSLVASYIYPVLIAPLFNKFTPLEDGDLKTRLTQLLGKTGFTAKSMFVMDASRRSGHSNAYFTGLGKNKRIVLFDTLIAQLLPEEIEAVLAHELGHYKHKHIVKKLCVMIPLIFAVLFFVFFVSKTPLLCKGFGFLPSTFELAAGETLPFQMQFLSIFLMGLSFGGFTPLFTLIENASSRRDEFQADAYSAKLCGGGKSLSTALIKLNKENLSEIVPPKIYSVFNYSHPPLLERIRAVSSPDKNNTGGSV
jgi:STE24 endopeptidase